MHQDDVKKLAKQYNVGFLTDLEIVALANKIASSKDYTASATARLVAELIEGFAYYRDTHMGDE